MTSKRIFYLLLLTLPELVLPQGIPITQAKTLQKCSFMLRSCQSGCENDPSKYVKWTILSNNADVDVECLLMDSTTPRSSSKNYSNPLETTFNVPCCENSDPSGPPVQSKLSIECLDDRKLNTLLILGVATLGCILLMSVFACVGLLFFRKRHRSYMLDGTNSDNRSTTKSSKKAPSTTLTFSDSSHGNNTPSSSLNSSSPPSRYLALKTVGAIEDKSNDNTSYVNTVRDHEKENKVEVNMQNYVEGEENITNGPRSIIVKKNGFDMPSAEEESIGNSRIVFGGSRLSGDFEIRGGFIKPKCKLTINKQNSGRFPKAVDFKLENEKRRAMTNPVHSTELPAVKTAKIEQQTTEDPYVDAPPIKSRSSTMKFETPGAYQTLLTNHTNSTEMNEYNTLLHNKTVANSDIKALVFLNNNSRQQTNCKNNKCEVTMKNGSAISNSAEA